MPGGTNSFFNIFKIPDLRKRILFTIAMLAIHRLGIHITIPGVNAAELSNALSSTGGVIGILDMFSGGALSKMSIFALGIMPYISASIIFQLLTTVIPYLEQLSKEGEQGRKKITQYTRLATVVICMIQASAITFMVHSYQGGRLVLNWGFGFQFMTILSLTTGTIFLMWLGEQITERGIGNGISLLIFIGIVGRIPTGFSNILKKVFVTQDLSPVAFMLFIVIVIALVALVVWVETAHRKIPVQYAKRISGRKVYGGQNTHLPLKVDQSGIIAVIFASAIITFPMILLNFFNNTITQVISDVLARGTGVYNILFAALVIFFCYFYTSITFNPDDVANNMKKYGGFIPGIRSGKPTANYVDKVLTRITLGGAIFVAFIALFPTALINLWSIPFFLGGTSLLILVGVDLDTMQQIESQLVMRHYDGFMKQGKIKSRR